MRGIASSLLALLVAGPAAGEVGRDPALGPWWSAPSVQLAFQPEESDGTDTGGFLLPFVDLDRTAGGYRVSVTSQRVKSDETLPMPECETSGTAGVVGAGRLVGEVGRYGRILLSDQGGGVVRIDFERTEGCVRSGRYLATWTAPH